MSDRQLADNAVDRCLEKLAEPGAQPAEIERSADRLLRYLQSEYAQMPEPRQAAWSAATRQHRLRWVAIAAVVTLLAGGLMLLQVDRGSPVATVEAGLIDGLKVGEVVAANRSLRVGSTTATLSLKDGSRVELSPQSEFSVRQVSDGAEVRLEKGNVLVTAAAQKDGHLYVRTADCTVSVTGTVFAVRAEKTGSRVSVYEGTVRVVQHDMTYTLTRGEQLATSPVLGAPGLETEVRWSSNAVAVLALLHSAAPIQAQSSVQHTAVLPGQESIEGILTNVTTGQPLPDGLILLGQRNNPRTLAEVKTGKDGRFKIEKTAPGTYYVVPSLAGFWAPDPPSLDVTLAAGESLQNIRLHMIPAATLSGRVTDEAGAPVKSASLMLMTLETPGGLRQANAGAEGGITNDRGEYEFTNVLPGTYYIKLPPKGSRTQSIYYPGTAIPDKAVAIDLPPGTITTGINFAAQAVKLYSVRFTVPRASLLWFDTIQRPIGPGSYRDSNVRQPAVQVPANVLVSSGRLVPLGKITDFENSRTVNTVRSEEYIVPGVPPGKYRLYVSWDGGPQRQADGRVVITQSSIQAEIEVTDTDVDLGKLASTPRNLSVPVQFTYANGRESEVTVTAISSIARNAISSAAARPFRLNYLAPGSYRLTFDTAPDHYVAIARYGGQDVLANPLELDGVDRGVLEVVVDGPGGSVEGMVRDAKGETVSNARVVLRGDSRTAITDQDGHFRFPGLAPGEYRVYAFEFASSKSFSDPAWFREYETRGTLVTVRKGQTASANLRIIPTR
jgi:ferric-dicitrate binding protein FerR (iron transport regulator)